MRAIKAIVIGMGLLIVGAVVFLFYGLSEGVGKLGKGGGALGEVSLAIPDGCVIADSGIEAGRLVLRLDGQVDRGCQQVILIDLESGRVTGRVTAMPSTHSQN